MLAFFFGFGDAALKAQKELAEKKRAMEEGKRPIHSSSYVLTLETTPVSVELAPIAVLPTIPPQSCLHAVVDQGVCVCVCVGQGRFGGG